jgi:hypothetical protein
LKVLAEEVKQKALSAGVPRPVLEQVQQENHQDAGNTKPKQEKWAKNFTANKKSAPNRQRST